MQPAKCIVFDANKRATVLYTIQPPVASLQTYVCTCVPFIHLSVTLVPVVCGASMAVHRCYLYACQHNFQPPCNHCQAGALQEGLLCKMCPTTSCYTVVFSASPLQPLEMQGIILFIYFGLVGYIRTCTVLTKYLCLSPLSHYVISTMLSLADMVHRRSVLLSQCACISVDNYIYIV